NLWFLITSATICFRFGHALTPSLALLYRKLKVAMIAVFWGSDGSGSGESFPLAQATLPKATNTVMSSSDHSFINFIFIIFYRLLKAWPTRQSTPATLSTIM